MGVFGNRLFEFRGGLRFLQDARASFRLTPMMVSSTGNQRKWGALLFGYFVLGKQNKVTRLVAKRNVIKKNI
ncbi:MAG TPA: hypothetical protein VES38_11870 [Methylotenera sp.]|nr:hypothetical protein [Methylotenera sp.]